MTINLKIPEDSADIKLIETNFSSYIKKEIKILDKEMNKYYSSSLNDNYPIENDKEPFNFAKTTKFFEIHLLSKCIGFIILIPGKIKTVMWLSDFYIEKAYQNKNYGNTALKKLKILIKEMGFKTITLTVFNENVNAVKLYEKNGFNIPISKTIACKL